MGGNGKRATNTNMLNTPMTNITAGYTITGTVSHHVEPHLAGATQTYEQRM